MDLDLVFLVLNYSVLPAWLLLAFAPRSRVTARVVFSALVPALLGTAYGVLLFTDREGSPEGSFFTLDGVMAIFTSRQTVIAAWVHYLIFDLFVGAWEVRDAARRGVPHLLVVPCLVLTLMLGPLGLLAYLALRAAMKRTLTLVEA
ncbi:MAG: ABA4-like family protein [Sandaracinaceae bacterium]|nr:ABA4-like family protein [Sandaracinaceae bacterium]